MLLLVLSSPAAPGLDAPTAEFVSAKCQAGSRPSLVQPVRRSRRFPGDAALMLPNRRWPTSSRRTRVGGRHAAQVQHCQDAGRRRCHAGGDDILSRLGGTSGRCGAGASASAPCRGSDGGPVAHRADRRRGLVAGSGRQSVWAGGKFNNARPAGAAAGTNLSPRSNLVVYDITTGQMVNFAVNPSLNAQVLSVAASPDGSPHLRRRRFHHRQRAGPTPGRRPTTPPPEP